MKLNHAKAIVQKPEYIEALQVIADAEAVEKAEAAEEAKVEEPKEDE